MEHFDAIIIGTGQAGKPLAGRLADAGWRVAIVERRRRVGGTCVLDGCTPTKTMVASARAAWRVRESHRWGVEVPEPEIDFARVRERKREVVASFSENSEKGLRRKENVELVFGHARFTGGEAGSGGHVVEVETHDDGVRRMSAPKVFVNTGTRTRVPDVPGLDGVDWLDNASIMELEAVPAHLAILGGGFVGVEFAQMFRRFGAQVTILEAGERLLPREDDDVAEGVLALLEDEGIGVRLHTRALRVEPQGDGIRIHLATSSTDPASGSAGSTPHPEASSRSLHVPTLDASHLLVAVGRVPNADDLGADEVGLERSDRGFIVVNDRLETSVPGIWALGDVNGGPPFTHVAYDDHRIVATNVLGDGSGDAVDPAGPSDTGASRAGRVLPYTLFTDPPLGRVGLTESDAREAGHDVRVATLPMERVARALETGETRGFMKAVVDADTKQILGAAILGIDGGDVATIVQTAMMGELPWTALRDAVFSHPTTGESLNNLFATLDAE